MNIRKIITIFAMFSLLGFASRGAATMINFDDVATGTIITNQYASLGVLFSIEGGGALPITATLAGEVISPPNTLVNNVDPVFGPNHPIRADFVVPANGSSPAMTDMVSITYISDDAGSGRMRAFNSLGNLLDETVSVIGGNQVETLTVQASGIAYVIIEPDLDILVDNFTFNEPVPQTTSVPEPSSGTMLMAGLLVYGLVRRARKRLGQSWGK